MFWPFCGCTKCGNPLERLAPEILTIGSILVAAYGDELIGCLWFSEFIAYGFGAFVYLGTKTSLTLDS